MCYNSRLGILAAVALAACGPPTPEPASLQRSGAVAPPVSSEAAIKIAREFIQGQADGAEYDLEPARIDTAGTAWLVYFPLIEVDRFPPEAAVAVDFQSGAARRVPLD